MKITIECWEVFISFRYHQEGFTIKEFIRFLYRGFGNIFKLKFFYCSQCDNFVKENDYCKEEHICYDCTAENEYEYEKTDVLQGTY